MHGNAKSRQGGLPPAKKNGIMGKSAVRRSRKGLSVDMSMHIAAKAGEIAPNILLPGDPMRAKHIAETYLEDAVCFNEIRGMYGYTGTYKGQRVSVMGTGMGIPSILIYATELARDYGCKKMIRLGTAGAYSEKLKALDLVLSQATSTTSALNDHIFPGHYAPCADFELLDKCYHIARERGLPVYVGNTICNDHLYIDNKEEYKKVWADYGVIASEMEGAGLYTVAARYGAKALTVMSIVETSFKPGAKGVSAEDKEKNLKDMILLALDTAID